MIVLLSICFTSWCQNDTILVTGVVEQDSVLVPISALKVANAKMIELKYEKEINENLKETIKLDSNIIVVLENNLYSCALELEEQIANCDEETNKLKKQRNIAIGAGSGTTALLILLLILAL